MKIDAQHIDEPGLVAGLRRRTHPEPAPASQQNTPGPPDQELGQGPRARPEVGDRAAGGAAQSAARPRAPLAGAAARPRPRTCASPPSADRSARVLPGSFNAINAVVLEEARSSPHPGHDELRWPALPCTRGTSPCGTGRRSAAACRPSSRASARPTTAGSWRTSRTRHGE